MRQRQLLASLVESGQQTPIVVVAAADQADRYVVIDGYKRIDRRQNSLCPLPPSTAPGGTNQAVEMNMRLRSAPSGEHRFFGS